MDGFHLQEICVAGLYFHWLVPTAGMGILAGLLFKKLTRSFGLTRYFGSLDLTALSICLGVCAGIGLMLKPV